MFCYSCKGGKCDRCVAAKQIANDSTIPLEEKVRFAVHTGLTVPYTFEIMDAVLTPLRNGKFIVTICDRHSCLNYHKAVTATESVKLLSLRGKQSLNLIFWRL